MSRDHVESGLGWRYDPARVLRAMRHKDTVVLAATERNTFALIAPVLGLAGAMAWRSRKRGALTLVGALTMLMLLSHTLQHAFPQTVLAMAKPLACVVLFVWLARLALQASAERAIIPTI